MDDTTRHRKARLRDLIDRRFGASQARLAEAAELTEGRVSQLLDPALPFGERAARNLAGALRLPERYFDNAGDANVSPGPDLHGPYPLISQVQAGNWTALADNFQPGDAEAWHASAHNLGKRGYLLRVVGNSMTCPTGPYSFPAGMLVHVNPDIEPMPGMFVVVRRQASLEATFKKYVRLNDAPYLMAINPDWPTDERYLKLQPGDTWCGVVVDASFGRMPGVG